MVRSVTDVAIVGGGLAGTALAAVLARRNIDVTLFDLHQSYPPDFRAEKLTAHQLAAFGRLGLDRPVLREATPFDELWIARSGRLVERRPNREYGMDYATLVNALRGLVPPACRRTARVAGLAASVGLQQLRLASGETVDARLAVVATGLGRSLLDDLGIVRRDVRRDASLAIGFDLFLAPGAPAMPPLTYYGERVGDRSAYLTTFPIADRLRANLFVYHRRDDSWSRAFRDQPEASLDALMPGLRALIGDYRIAAPPALRPIHLYGCEGHRRDGAVLIGDAFSTTCPTGGTGIDKVLTDVEQLAALVPSWLASDGMGAGKIAAFYGSRAKLRSDRRAADRTAYARALALDEGMLWAARRAVQFHAQRARNTLRRRRPSRADGAPA